MTIADEAQAERDRLLGARVREIYVGFRPMTESFEIAYIGHGVARIVLKESKGDTSIAALTLDECVARTLQWVKRPKEDAVDQFVPAWQPIETAPKDGRYILLLNEARPKYPRVGYWGDTSECFVTDWRSLDWTHWAPIPAFPGADQ